MLSTILCILLIVITARLLPSAPQLSTDNVVTQDVLPVYHPSRTNSFQSSVSPLDVNYQLTSDPSNTPQNEPGITVDPLNNSIVAGGANDYRLVTQGFDAWLGIYSSKDSGTTWTNNLIPGYPGGSTTVLSSYTTGSDPSLAYDSNGNLYYAGIVFNRLPNGAGIDGTVFAAKMSNTSTTWTEKIVSSGTSTIFNDKPHIATDTTNNSSHKGSVYISWTRFTGTGPGTILFSRSTNGGTSYSAPIILSSGSDNQGSVPYLGPTASYTSLGTT